jgi:hypothetical protein
MYLLIVVKECKQATTRLRYSFANRPIIILRGSADASMRTTDSVLSLTTCGESLESETSLRGGSILLAPCIVINLELCLRSIACFHVRWHCVEGGSM